MEQWISNLQPLHWLAIAIFLGLALLASAVNRLADTLKKERRIGKSDEAQALESCAHILAQIRDGMPKPKPSKAERERVKAEAEQAKRNIVAGWQGVREAMIQSGASAKTLLDDLEQARREGAI